MVRHRCPLCDRGLGTGQAGLPLRRSPAAILPDDGRDAVVAGSCVGVLAVVVFIALRPQLTACFTSALIVASSAAVNCLSAKEVGHMPPSSRFALSLKPNVAYLDLNFCALWKKQTTLPSLA